MGKMKAVGLYRYLPIDDSESLIDLHIAKPVPAGKDLLVQVKAIAVNPIDTKVRSPKPMVESSPRVLGWDVAGIVEATGPACTLFRPGDEVYYAGDITRQGGNSEYHLIDERIVGTKPKTLGYAEAAALPLTTLTAHEGMFARLGISRNPEANAGKAILIIGAAGGVGSIAVQLAKLAGLTVIGTASRPESAKWALEHGADHTINHFEHFVPQLRKLGFAAVPYIFCTNTTERHWANMTEAIEPQGKICAIVGTRESLNLTLLHQKSAMFVWEFMFTRPMFKTDDMIEQHHILNEVAALVDSGKIKTTLTERLSPINAANLREAHRMLETGKTIGKIVLEQF